MTPALLCQSQVTKSFSKNWAVQPPKWLWTGWGEELFFCDPVHSPRWAAKAVGREPGLWKCWRPLWEASSQVPWRGAANKQKQLMRRSVPTEQLLCSPGDQLQPWCCSQEFLWMRAILLKAKADSLKHIPAYAHLISCTVNFSLHSQKHLLAWHQPRWLEWNRDHSMVLTWPNFHVWVFSLRSVALS